MDNKQPNISQNSLYHLYIYCENISPNSRKYLAVKETNYLQPLHEPYSFFLDKIGKSNSTKVVNSKFIVVKSKDTTIVGYFKTFSSIFCHTLY